jgi:phytoene dehydrogenase-like protein
MASFGVAREFPGEAPYITVKLKDPIELDGHRLDHMQLRIFNYSDRFSPPGKSVIQATAEMGWDFWCGLREKDKGAYDDAKQRLSAEFLKRFEARYPGISSQVEVTDVATPYTTWRYTLNRKGAWGGWKMSPRMAATRIEMMLPGLGSFLMAGHWVMPGVSGAIFSGRHAVQLMCHFDGRPFEVAAPAA